MLRTILKLFSFALFGITLFVFWNLFYTRTIVASPDKPISPQVIYILSYEGYHNSLLIRGDHGWKEFSYGDWEVYGKSNINFWTGFKSMGWPSKGAIGFQNVEWDGMDESELYKNLNPLRIISTTVESDKATTLYSELEKLIETNWSTGVFNPDNNLFFVTHPKSYMAWHTCNNMLIEWLSDLGLHTAGNGWAGNFVMDSE